MLEKEIFKKEIQKLVDLYPRWEIDITDTEILGNWYQQLNHYESEIFKKIVQKYIENEKFPPTVAGLKEYEPGDEMKVMY